MSKSIPDKQKTHKWMFFSGISGGVLRGARKYYGGREVMPH